MLAKLESLRRSHHCCEDGWWSCPKQPNWFRGDHSQGGPDMDCDCGADKANATLDEVLAELRLRGCGG